MTSTMQSAVQSTLCSSLRSAVNFDAKSELVNDDEVTCHCPLVLLINVLADSHPHCHHWQPLQWHIMLLQHLVAMSIL